MTKMLVLVLEATIQCHAGIVKVVTWPVVHPVKVAKISCSVVKGTAHVIKAIVW